MDKWKALRDALAAGPTPGPWRAHGSDISGNGRWVADTDIGPDDDAPILAFERDAKYIAACDPDTIRALLAAADEEKRRAEMLAGTIDSHNKACLRSCERRRDVGNACTARAWRCSDCPRLYRIDAARK